MLEIGECVTCRDNPSRRVCWHGLPMWSVVHHTSITGLWTDLHGHTHTGHRIVMLPATKFQVVVTPAAEVLVLA